MSEISMPKKSNTKKYIHFGVVLAFMFLFKYLPPIGGLETVGMQVLGIFIGSIYGWIMVDIAWTSLIGMIALGTSEAMTFTQVISSGLGSQYFILTAMMLFMAAAMTELNLTQVIISKLFNLKIIQGRPWLMMFVFLLAVYIVALMTNLVVSTLVFLELYRGMAKSANVPHHHKINSAFLGGVSMADSMGDISLPFKTSVLVILGMYGAASGETVDMMKYLIGALPITLMALVLYVLTCKYILRLDISPLKDSSFSIEVVHATKRQKWVLAMFGVMIAFLLAPNILPANLSITAVLKNLNVGGISVLFIALMMLIHVDGEPLLDLKALMKNYHYGMLIIMGYFMPLASTFSSDSVGIKAMMVNLFQPLLEGLSSYGFVVAIIIITVVLTNLLNNLPVGSIFASLVLVLADGLPDINILAVVIMIILACFISIVLPSANVPNAIIFGQKDLISFKNQVMVTFTCATVFVIFLLTIGYAWLNFVL